MWSRRVAAGPAAAAEIVFTDRSGGDFHIDGPPDPLRERRQGLFAGEWTWLRQTHGADVVVVEHPGDSAGREADGAVTATPGAVLCVQTADCVPIVLVGDGVVGVAHAGWRGLVAGVVAATVDALGALGGGDPHAVIGPCIRPAAYEFGPEPLALVEAAVGGPVRARTADGRLALDMGSAASRALRAAGVSSITDAGFDTADQNWFSHRVRGDEERQVTAVRLVPA